jgi:hypothetical protein
LTQLDQPELGRHEKPVQQDQQESDKNEKKVLSHTPGKSRILFRTKKSLFCPIDAGMSCGYFQKLLQLSFTFPWKRVRGGVPPPKKLTPFESSIFHDIKMKGNLHEEIEI